MHSKRNVENYHLQCYSVSYKHKPITNTLQSTLYWNYTVMLSDASPFSAPIVRKTLGERVSLHILLQPRSRKRLARCASHHWNQVWCGISCELSSPSWSLLCFEGFSPGTPVFLSLQNQHIQAIRAHSNWYMLLWWPCPCGEA